MEPCNNDASFGLGIYIGIRNCWSEQINSKQSRASAQPKKKEEKEKTTNYLVISHHYSKPYNSRRLLIQLPLGLHQTNAPANPTSPSPGTNDPQVNTPKNCGECR
jgi:hypothetical protein